ncbi:MULTISPECIES: aa3-type cytochrome c oxidase subunit IV [unclassified Rhizobium]|uniref:aa3-type cytochrome c oxidase subunit IV n=1 Tax=unclassified Rhizobium TaxID=2613769 RepID=UPI001AD9A7C2|nr:MULTISPECIES: aa3-type cytochrome c oxidase subunit IV [unclassified Rhizobium]MBO9099774.1 aa3-type cytochrome c oxidase subunit IV [Rhizobium sp. L58/93]MBO9131683.1 aa3-type cytochrome c oxidase subunit IV [Rhizobium sp. B209b/85]MBO9169763.1 aa3-type cytochrome c oxidase subunit IV [Rhizobium sp. L245/93]MBO9185721.1 aa3-type cytochrome c oxidase subunit IV [Rhizobium sp. E27B/91]QXZ82484.1 aa3-type cytochrome c oxidase subunit IV [Rhizobium sp. K1/93]
MAEHPTGPSETGAPMDYNEHEKTYSLFLNGAKLLSVFVAALLIAMAGGFFGHAGLVGGVLIFVVVAVVGYIMTR